MIPVYRWGSLDRYYYSEQNLAELDRQDLKREGAPFLLAGCDCEAGDYLEKLLQYYQLEYNNGERSDFEGEEPDYDICEP
jgi:hypothetical protein